MSLHCMFRDSSKMKIAVEDVRVFQDINRESRGVGKRHGKMEALSEVYTRSKLVLISILACKLGFHAITSERGTFTIIAILKIKPVCSTELVGVTILPVCCAWWQNTW